MGTSDDVRRPALLAVQEFTVYTNASSAEWGWNAGTAVNVVTRSGSNDWHGDFVGMGSLSFSNASVPLAAKPVQETLAQGSGMLSGPIVKDKTYFMVSGEYTNQNRPAVITSPVDPGSYYNGTFGPRRSSSRVWISSSPRTIC